MIRSGLRLDRGEVTLPPLVYMEGTISTFVEQDIRSIVHTAAISADNSGGPLINRKGEVVDINIWGQSPDTGVSVHASLTAADMVAFILRHGYTPLTAEGAGFAGHRARLRQGRSAASADASGKRRPRGKNSHPRVRQNCGTAFY